MQFFRLIFLILWTFSCELSHCKIAITKNPLCRVDERLFAFLSQFLTSEFRRTNINIIYNSTNSHNVKPLTSLASGLKENVAAFPDFCESTREKFHHELSKTNAMTGTVTFFNPDPEMKGKLNGHHPSLNFNSTSHSEDSRNEKLIGFHLHQHSSWSELNLIVLFDGSVAPQLTRELIKLRHFQRENSFNIFWQRENRQENFLELQPLQKLKYKIELCTSVTTEDGSVAQVIRGDSSSLELYIKSVCFYCDFGYPESQSLWLWVIPFSTLKSHNNANNHRLTMKNNNNSSNTFNTPTQFLVPRRADIFRDYTKNMYGKTLQVSLSKGIPTMMSFKVLKNQRVETNGGFQIRLFHMIRRKLNFSYNITVESSFGIEGSDGVFSGMVGAVQTGRADLGIGATVTHNRAKVVHYLTPNTFHLVTFITGNPKTRPEWQFIFLAFTLPTWIFVFCTAALLVYPMFVVSNICICILEGNKGHNREPFIIQRKITRILIKGVEFIVRAICEQRWIKDGYNLKYCSIRVLSVFWLVGLLFIRTELKCNLMKMAVSPPLEKLPTTFAELADSDYEIYTHYSGGSLDRILRTTHSHTFDKITQKMKTETSITKCLKETVNTHAACILYEDDGIIEGQKYFTDPQGHLLIHRAPSGSFNFFASVILPKEAVYIESMERTVSQIVDMGITKRFHDEQYEATRIKGQRLAKKKHMPVLEFDIDSGHHYEKLRFKHLLAAFVILGIGSSMAALVSVVEKRTFLVPGQFYSRGRDKIFIVRSRTTERKED